MRIFKNKLFSRWAKKIGLENYALKIAIDEISMGLYEANLGGHLYKKRVGIKGKGKRGGVRTILTFKKDDKALFIYGFAKSDKENFDKDEENLCKKTAAVFLSWSNNNINTAIKNKEIIEVFDGQDNNRSGTRNNKRLA
jgi:hypothetical protein